MDLDEQDDFVEEPYVKAMYSCPAICENVLPEQELNNDECVENEQNGKKITESGDNVVCHVDEDSTENVCMKEYSVDRRTDTGEDYLCGKDHNENVNETKGKRVGKGLCTSSCSSCWNLWYLWYHNHIFILQESKKLL